MKVVLFCGGLGLRIRDGNDPLPKPLVPVGAQPILWHLMKYYAHQGHNEFILCLGYKAEAIKEYFLTYNEAMTNDFVFADGGKEVIPLKTDLHDWRITFVDTGLNSTIGERLLTVRDHLGDDEYFLANYSDVLTDASLEEMIDRTVSSGATALCMAVRPTYTYHTLGFDEDGTVTHLQAPEDTPHWINGGFFVFSTRIFDLINPGEDLVIEPFARLIESGELLAYPYRGFWAVMDTLREKNNLDVMIERGDAPWITWASEAADARSS